MILELSDDNKTTKHYFGKTYKKVQNSSKNKKSKPVVINNVLLSKNSSQTTSSKANIEKYGLKPVDESSNVQIPTNSYNVLLNCEYKY